MEIRENKVFLPDEKILNKYSEDHTLYTDRLN